MTKWSPTEREWGLAMALIQAEERERIAKFRYRVDMVSSFLYPLAPAFYDYNQ